MAINKMQNHPSSIATERDFVMLRRITNQPKKAALGIDFKS
jgi:hypothetical protein